MLEEFAADPFTNKYLELLGHVKHVESAVELVYLPATQSLHMEAADSFEYLLNPQSMHSADPPFALNCPGTHSIHGPPSAPDEPAVQMQSAKDGLPSEEMEDDGQLRHVVDDDDPFTTEYFPGSHAIQSVNSSLSVVSTYLPAGHHSHVLPDDAPFTTEYLPGTHAIQ